MKRTLAPEALYSTEWYDLHYYGRSADKVEKKSEQQSKNKDEDRALKLLQKINAE